jgi:hypothetical protein
MDVRGFAQVIGAAAENQPDQGTHEAEDRQESGHDLPGPGGGGV